MNFQNVAAWLPQAFYVFFAAGIVLLLLRFKRRNDPVARFKALQENAARAGENEDFRVRELRLAEADLAANPPPEADSPLKRNHQLCIHAIPKLALLTGLAGVVILYFGLFQPGMEGESSWMLVAGPLLLLVTGGVILATAGIRKNFDRLQILNRLYVMRKAGKDLDGSLKTLERIMLYYPAVPGLWLERADILSKTGRLDEALTAIGKSRELSPSDMDLAVIEASYLLRKGDMVRAAAVVESLPGMRKAETDPRPNIYAAALALKRGDKKAALAEAEWAKRLDSRFTGKFLSRDECLADLEAFMRENKLLAGKDGE